jgi:tetratricopeptide (TPR) repeat protein
LVLNPADLQAQYNRGVVLTELGRLDEALAAFERVLARASDDPAALYNKANVLARLRRYEEALEAYGRILAQHPRDIRSS